MAHKFRRDRVRPLHRLRVALTSSVPTNDIFVGDLLGMSSNFVVPVTAWAWTTDEATTRTAFVAAFVGLSNDRSRLGSTDARDLLIEAHTDGFIEFDCVSGTYEVGDKVGPTKAAGNALLNTVKVVSAEAEAVGVVIERGATVTKITAKLVNTVLDRTSI